MPDVDSSMQQAPIGQTRRPTMEAELFKQLSWISDKYRGRHDERRRFENNYVVSAITVLVLGGAGLTLDNVRIPTDAKICIVWFPIVLAAVTSAFLWSIHNSNHADMEQAREAEKLILDHYSINNSRECSNFRKNVRRWRNWFLQSLCLVVTAMIVSAFGTLVIDSKATLNKSGSAAATAAQRAP